MQRLAADPEEAAGLTDSHAVATAAGVLPDDGFVDRDEGDDDVSSSYPPTPSSPVRAASDRPVSPTRPNTAQSLRVEAEIDDVEMRKRRTYALLLHGGGMKIWPQAKFTEAQSEPNYSLDRTAALKDAASCHFNGLLRHLASEERTPPKRLYTSRSMQKLPTTADWRQGVSQPRALNYGMMAADAEQARAAVQTTTTTPLTTLSLLEPPPSLSPARVPFRVPQPPSPTLRGTPSALGTVASPPRPATAAGRLLVPSSSAGDLQRSLSAGSTGELLSMYSRGRSTPTLNLPLGASPGRFATATMPIRPSTAQPQLRTPVTPVSPSILTAHGLHAAVRSHQVTVSYTRQQPPISEEHKPVRSMCAAPAAVNHALRVAPVAMRQHRRYDPPRLRISRTSRPASASSFVSLP